MTGDERAEASTRIAERLEHEELSRLEPGAVVALYAAKGSEVATAAVDAAARARGLRVVYPRVSNGDRVLMLCEVSPEKLVAGRFGLQEPAADAPGVAIDEVSLFVVPGVAFDRAGGRLGWGHGHYDATLAKARPDARRVGIAFECQVVDRLRREPHDEVMHVIVTEVATHVVA